MKTEWQKRMSHIVRGIVAFMFLYLILKLGGGIPSPSPIMLPWNLFDFVVMKVLYFLLFAVPAVGVLILVHLYIRSMIDRKYEIVAEELNTLKKQFEWEIRRVQNLHSEESQKQQQAIYSLRQEINTIKDGQKAQAISVTSIEEQTLNNFL